MIELDGSFGTLGEKMLGEMRAKQERYHSNPLLKMRPILLVDIDGTLRDHCPRQNLMPSNHAINEQRRNGTGNRAFDKFNDSCHLDEPLQRNIDLVKALSKSHVVVLLSACSASAHTIEHTHKQMISWGVPFSAIFMRHTDNHTPTPDFKLEFLKKSGMSVWGKDLTTLEDDHKNFRAFHNAGYSSFLCADSNNYLT
jgi:hypothetical protein